MGSPKVSLPTLMTLVTTKHLNIRRSQNEFPFTVSSFFGEPIFLSTGLENYGKDGWEKIFQVEVKEYFTAVSGTCYQIRSNTTIPPSNIVSIVLRFNDSLGPKDLPQVST